MGGTVVLAVVVLQLEMTCWGSCIVVSLGRDKGERYAATIGSKRTPQSFSIQPSSWPTVNLSATDNWHWAWFILFLDKPFTGTCTFPCCIIPVL